MEIAQLCPLRSNLAMYQSTSSPFRQSSHYGQPPPPALQTSQLDNNNFYSNQQSFSGPQFGGGANSWSNSNSPAKQNSNPTAFGQSNPYGSTSTQSPYAPQHSTAYSHNPAASHPNPQQSFTGETTRHYLPGYLSGGALTQVSHYAVTHRTRTHSPAQSHATPPQSGHDDSRTWDSPASRASVSASPVSRFGGQSLFGPRDGYIPIPARNAFTPDFPFLRTPSRSPKAGLFSRELPKSSTSRVVEMDEDAPPVESLGEMDGNDSMGLSPGKPTRHDR